MVAADGVGRATAVLANAVGGGVYAVPPHALPTSTAASTAMASLMDVKRWRLQRRFGRIANDSGSVTSGSFDYVRCHAQSHQGFNLDLISFGAVAGASQKSSASYSKQSCV